MAEFEEVCYLHNIELFALPPKSPKPSGHVERIQRALRDELYARPSPSRIPELQRELGAYLRRLQPQEAAPGPERYGPL